MNKKSALLFGATGLTGSCLLKQLLNDSRYEKVKIFSRKKTELPSNEKSEVHVVDFSSSEKYSQLLTGDDLFCCLGTTIAKAGSKNEFRKVDL